MKRKLAENGGGNSEELILVTCIWCGNTALSSNPRQCYCDNPNCKTYRSKRRTRELQRLIENIAWVYSNFRLTPDRLDDCIGITKARWELIAAGFGYSYSDEARTWIQTCAVQSAPTSVRVPPRT